jgi:hypothetical protein
VTRNLDTAAGRLADVLRDQDAGRIAELLSPDVIWEGMHRDLRCEGRDQAMSIIRRQFGASRLAVDAVEAVAAGARW